VLAPLVFYDESALECITSNLRVCNTTNFLEWIVILKYVPENTKLLRAAQAGT